MSRFALELVSQSHQLEHVPVFASHPLKSKGGAPVFSLLTRLRTARLPRLLLAAFLVPVVIMANPTTANAASSGLLRYSFEGFAVKDVGLGWANCQVSWTMPTDSSIFVQPTSRCDGGPDLTPGACQAFEAGCGSFGWVVKDGDGETCGSTGLPTAEAEGNGVKAVRTLLTGGTAQLVPRETCEPVEACLSYYWDGAGPGASDMVDCAAISVDAPDIGDTCLYGTPQKPYTSESIREDAPPVDSILDWIHIEGNVSVPSTNPYDRDPYWVYYVITQRDPATATDGLGQKLQFYQGAPPFLGYVQTNKKIQRGTSEKIVGDWYPDGRVDPGRRLLNRVVGVGVFFAGFEGYDVADRSHADGDNYGIVGYSDPGRCRWYWGVPIAKPTADGAHVPIGPAKVDSPEPTDPPPVVEPPDEETESFWWVWALLRALQAIVSAISNLASTLARAIADALTGAFKTLFVPDTDGYKVDQLVDQFQSKPPFSVVYEGGQAVQTAARAYTAAGGCAVLFTIPGYQQATCQDASTAATALRGLASFGLISLTALSMFYRVSSVFRAGQ